MTNAITHIKSSVLAAVFPLCVLVLAGVPAHTARAVDYGNAGCCGSAESYGWSGGSTYYSPTYDWSSGSTYSAPSYSYSSGGGYASGGGLYYYGDSSYGAWPMYSSGTHYATGGNVSFTPSTYTSSANTSSWPAYDTTTHYATGGGITYTAPTSYSSSGSYYSGYAAPTCHLTAYQQYINQGGSTTLSWSSNNATYGSVSSIGTVSPNGTVAVAPGATTGYTATFYGPGGQVNCYATVAVNGSAAASSMQSISLSQVPYTGLDLGPIGTVIYWVVLLGIVALLAYALAVKKIFTGTLASARVIFFGDPAAPSHPVYKAQAVAVRMSSPAATVGGAWLPSAGGDDVMDDFIRSQVKR